MPFSLPVSVSGLLPHEGRMCCIDALLFAEGDSAVAAVTVKHGHALVTGGILDRAGFIEVAAQAAGARQGFLRKKCDLPPGQGFLVGAQDFAIRKDAREGDTLELAVQLRGEFRGVSIITVCVRRDGEELAAGKLKVFEPPATAGGVGIAAQRMFPESRREIRQKKEGDISVYEAVLCSLTAKPAYHGGVRKAEFVFREDFAGFEGHFPGNPIVPGIVQIYAAQITAGAMDTVAGAGDERKARLKEAGRCKFMRPVLPGEVLRVALSGEWEGDVMRCKAELTADNEPCSTMTLVLERAE